MTHNCLATSNRSQEEKFDILLRGMKAAIQKGKDNCRELKQLTYDIKEYRNEVHQLQKENEILRKTVQVTTKQNQEIQRERAKLRTAQKKIEGEYDRRYDNKNNYQYRHNYQKNNGYIFQRYLYSEVKPKQTSSMGVNSYIIELNTEEKMMHLY